MIRVVFRILNILHETFPCTLVVLYQLRYIVSHPLCRNDRILVSYSIMVFQRYKIGVKKFGTRHFYIVRDFHLEYFSMTACSPISRISFKRSSKRVRLCAISSFVSFPVAVLFFSTNFSLYAKLERLMLSCIFKPT